MKFPLSQIIGTDDEQQKKHRYSRANNEAEGEKAARNKKEKIVCKGFLLK